MISNFFNTINTFKQFILDKYNFCLTANAAQVRFALLWTFLASIILYPIGPSIRELMPTICLALLFRYYYLDWNNSTLKRFKAKYLFYIFAVGLCIGVIFSTNITDSLMHVLRHLNKGFAYPFIAMECIRSTKDLRKIIYTFVIVGLWQGLNGVYQAFTGYDFINNSPLLGGRLTGSMSTYRVGNYMALVLVPALSLWYLMKEKFQPMLSTILCALIFSPALFLLIFTYTRSAYLALSVGIVLHFFINSPKKYWLYFIIPIILGIITILILPGRFGIEYILNDGRWDLWRLAYEIFIQYPLTGAGFFQFNEAFRELGLVPAIEKITISHPHSIYIQLLSESGILGASCFFTFLFGIFIWAYKKIRTGLRNSDHNVKLYWKLTSFFWAGWGAFLANGIFGHDFFRLWWFPLATTILGIMIGACINEPKEK